MQRPKLFEGGCISLLRMRVDKDKAKMLVVNYVRQTIHSGL